MLQRARHRDHVHLDRGDHPPPGRRARRRRRSDRLRLVGEPRAMSRIGRKPIELPSGVMVALSPGRVQVNGPLGELSQVVPARMQIERGRGGRRHPPDRARRGPGSARPDPDAHREHGRGSHQGLRAPGDPRRRVPRPAQGHRPRARRRFLASGHDQAARESPSTCRRRPRSSSRASTSRPSGRPPPRSARSGRPSRTRARASATATSRSAGRSGSA